MACILLVEPDVLVRSPLAEYLRECGYRVWEASNVADARILIADQPASISIVLAEAESPGENGFALAAWIRRQHPHIDVILAGSVTTVVAKAGDLCEQGTQIKKPYDHQLVLAQIRRLRAARDRND
jgi:DNA-binding response OmpR family regulator